MVEEQFYREFVKGLFCWRSWFETRRHHYCCCCSFSLCGMVSMIEVSHKKKTGAEGLFFYHPSLLCCPDQILAVMKLSQHLVSSSKTVRPFMPLGFRCVGHVEIMWSAVCSLAPHSNFAEKVSPHLCMDEPKRSAPADKRLSLTQTVVVKLISIDLVLTLGM